METIKFILMAVAVVYAWRTLFGGGEWLMAKSIAELITKINEWADDRNLKQADPKIQWMRITEEVGEIRDVLLKPTKFTEPQAHSRTQSETR